MLQKMSGLCIIVYLLFSPAFAQLTITTALCENKQNPLGVDVQNLHFSWMATANEHNQYQTAYQLVIASSEEKLTAANYDVYNSAKVATKQSVQVKYRGTPLLPANTYYWKVR